MNFPFLLPILAIFFIITKCETNESSTITNEIGEWSNSTDKTNATTVNVKKKNDTSSSKLPNLCTICHCNGKFVNCSDRGLKNSLEKEQWIKDAVIEEISFKGNHLAHVVAFPAITIRKLILRQNQITVIDNCAFKELINLTELDLSHNQLTTERLNPQVFEGAFSPESYEPLSKLRVLNLGSNILHALHQDVFEHLPNLRVLILAGNQLKVIESHTTLAISSLPFLEELDLSYCDLEELPKYLFHKPRYLKKLQLSGNRFTSPPIALESAQNLEYLYLDENLMRTLNETKPFAALPKLKELSLCCMPYLTTIGRGVFSRLTALQVLRVQNCPHLEEIDENALAEENGVWPPLRKLDLSDNALRYLPSQLVGRWDKLEELDLTNNQWSCDCENQYLIGSLLPQEGKRLMGEEMYDLKCGAPLEHMGKNLTSLSNRHLRCLDVYDAQPEKDGAILIGILIGLLLALPVGVAIFALWQRGFFFCGSQGPASFSRAFYKRTANEDDM